MALFILDVQHQGKPSRLRDRGAVRGEVEEVTLTRAYADVADGYIRQEGHDCLILSDGEYKDRAARADSYGPVCYVACHINAGNGVDMPSRRAEIYHWPGSVNGERFAESIGKEMLLLLKYHVRVLPATTPNVRYTIASVKAPALCFEPDFIEFPVDPHFIGRALAIGLIKGL